MKAVRVVLEIRMADDGRIVSARHEPATQEDADELMGMRFGGQDVVAAALMGEAIRRDALLRVCLVAATDPARASRLRAGDTRDAAELAASVLDTMESVTRQMAPRAVAEALRTLEGAD